MRLMAAAKEADPHKSRSTTGKLKKKKKKSLSALVTVHHLFRTISMDVNDVDFHRKAPEIEKTRTREIDHVFNHRNEPPNHGSDVGFIPNEVPLSSSRLVLINLGWYIHEALLSRSVIRRRTRGHW
jgi:hypothetical protein